MPGYIRQKFSNRYKWKADAKVTKLQKALILILMLTIQPEHGHAYKKQADQLPTANTNQFIIFQEIGEMAADLSYIHMTLPLDISTLYQQAEVF